MTDVFIAYIAKSEGIVGGPQENKILKI